MMKELDTTKASGNPIPDGIYFVQPDGSAWQAVEFRHGRLADIAYEADAGTHAASGDRWAGVGPADDDELLDTADEQLSIDIALACGREDAYGVSVARPCSTREPSR